MLESVFKSATVSVTEVTPLGFLLCTLASVVLGIFIALASTYRSRVTQSFVITLALLPTIVQGAKGLVSGGAHIFGHEIRAIFKAFAEGDNEKAKDLFVPIYRFCKSTGQNGRILPNSILRPAIEAVTGIKLGHARLPLAPPTEEEMAVTLGILKEIGKL